MSESEENTKKVVGTSDMPEPQVINYSALYETTEKFRNDLNITLFEMPYVDAEKVYEYFRKYNWVIPVNVLNEAIRHISRLPYKYVCGIMKNIEGDFNNYFKIHNNGDKK